MKQAFENGIIMSGISAGANCWFEKSFSDSVPGKEFSFVTGLGFVQGCMCPHYNDNRRKTCFNYEIRNRNDLPSIAFGIEENNAIIIDNGEIKKISENNTENGIYIFNKKKEIKR